MRPFYEPVHIKRLLTLQSLKNRNTGRCDAAAGCFKHGTKGIFSAGHILNSIANNCENFAKN
jgi:hypothetical protein